MARARSTTARRYAEAAFELAERDGVVEAWLDQLDRLTAALSDHQIVRRLEQPQVPIEVRQEAVRGILGDAALPQVANLLALILRRRRLEMLPGVAREFRRLYNRRAGIAEATATSAAPLERPEIDALRARLEQMTGGSVELELRVDPALLGGIQVRLGDLLIDGSVRGRLERLRGRLATGSISP